MTAATDTAHNGPEAPVPVIAPAEFMRRMKRLVQARAWSDVVALYDRHGPSVLDRLSHAQLLRVEEIMHMADTVVELEAAAAARR
jgi:hypothetical protein